MKDEIVRVLKNSDGALSIYDIKDELELEEVSELEELSTALRELEDDCVIYHSNKDKYMLKANNLYSKLKKSTYLRCPNQLVRSG